MIKLSSRVYKYWFSWCPLLLSFFLGEKGFALVPFYKLFEEAIYYSIGFPIAKSYSPDISKNYSLMHQLKSAVADKFVIVAVSSIALSLLQWCLLPFMILTLISPGPAG
jgi:hypothetical protein